MTRLVRRHRTARKVVAKVPRDSYIDSMAKQSTKKRSPSTGAFVTLKVGKSRRNVTTTLGEVTVRGDKPSAALVQANVARSTQALERVGKKLAKPGVYLPEKRDVPRYSADENNPGVFIRRLNGKVTIGRLQNGQFVESK